jgi:hypothetical protein
MAEAAIHHRQRPGALNWSALAVDGLGGAITPLMHTGRYFAQPWRDYLGQAAHELPIARPTIALAAQAFRDEVVLIGLKARRPVSRPDVFERITRGVVAGSSTGRKGGWKIPVQRFVWDAVQQAGLLDGSAMRRDPA